MTALTYDFTIEQGATFSRDIEIQDGNGDPIDLTGSTFAAKLRSRYSESATLATFTCAIQGSAVLGILRMSLTAAQTSTIEVDDADGPSKQFTYGCYDLEWTKADASIVRLIEGVVKISPEVTR